MKRMRLSLFTFVILCPIVIGCSAALEDNSDWLSDDVQESELDSVESDLTKTCIEPATPEVSLMSPASEDVFELTGDLEITAHVSTCRRLKAVYAEITEPSMPTDKAPRLHKYGLLDHKDDPATRSRSLRVPKKARTGTYALRLVVKSWRAEEYEDKQGRVRKRFVLDEVSLGPIAFHVRETMPSSDGGIDPLCINGQTRPCGSDVGECTVGTETCTAGAWGGCTGIAPTTEQCGTGKDEDCNGLTDEGCGTTSCLASSPLASRANILPLEFSYRPSPYVEPWGNGLIMAWKTTDGVHVTRFKRRARAPEPLRGRIGGERYIVTSIVTPTYVASDLFV